MKKFWESIPMGTVLIVPFILLVLSHLCNAGMDLITFHPESMPVWLTAGAAKWGLFDFIPHDGWHFAKFGMYFFLNIGFVLTFINVNKMIRVIKKEYTLYSEMSFVNCSLSFIGAFTLNAVARGIGFSLPYKILSGTLF